MARCSVTVVALTTLMLITPGSASASTCAEHANQAEAQRAKDTRDADGDGIYCESLPCPCLRPGASNDPAPTPAAAPTRGRILRARAVITDVVDGDTVKVRTNASGRSGGIAAEETVRLIGIDTPETSKPGYPVECGGPQATDAMTRAALGRTVRLRTDPTQDTRDRYGRLLAYVDRSSGNVDLGAYMVRSGWAKRYVYRDRFGRYKRFTKAQDTARRSGRGVWAMCGGNFHRAR